MAAAFSVRFNRTLSAFTVIKIFADDSPSANFITAFASFRFRLHTFFALSGSDVPPLHALDGSRAGGAIIILK